MKVNLLFFGATAELANERKIVFEIGEDSTASTVFDLVIVNYPQLAVHKLQLSVNQQYASGDEIVKDGDEIAVFTAVSGG